MLCQSLERCTAPPVNVAVPPTASWLCCVGAVVIELAALPHGR